MDSETSELSEWPCPLCHRNIRGKLSIANHRKNLYRQAGSTRCDYDLTEDVPDVFEPDEEPGSAIRVQNAAAHIDGVVVLKLKDACVALIPCVAYLLTVPSHKNSIKIKPLFPFLFLQRHLLPYFLASNSPTDLYQVLSRLILRHLVFVFALFLMIFHQLFCSIIQLGFSQGHAIEILATLLCYWQFGSSRLSIGPYNKNSVSTVFNAV